MSDLIRREDAIDIVDELFALGDCYCDRFSVVGALRGIPSAEPERKKGELKTVGFLTCQCTECGAQFHELEYTNFCPNCGADMRGE